MGGVRPALHLNLNSAALSAAEDIPMPTDPDDKTYNGLEQDITGESWYTDNATAFDSTTHCQIKYKKGSQLLTSKPKDAGTYTAEIRFITDKYFFDGNASTKTKTVTYTIKPKELNADFSLDSNGEPKLTVYSGLCGSDTQADLNETIKFYDSSNNEVAKTALSKNTTYQAEITLGNANYTLPSSVTRIDYEPPAGRVKASWLSASADYIGSQQTFDLIFEGGEPGQTVATAALKGTYDSTVEQTGPREFKATNAGTYTVTLSLTNKDEYVWDSTNSTDDIDLQFKIDPITVKMYIPSFTPPNWAVTQGYKAKANVELPALKSGTGDTLTVYLSAFFSGNSIRNLCAIDLDTDTHSIEYELDTDTLPVKTYDLGIVYDDPTAANSKNYVVVLDKSYSFTVKQPSENGGLIWRLMQGSSFVSSQADPADIDTTTFSKKITYNGKSYTFVINADGLGYEVDTDYNSNGFLNGYKTVAKGKTASLTNVTNAGEYVTTVHLKNDEGEKDFYIEWKIDKVKFDLSKVSWLEDGKISYSERGMTIDIDPETLPEGLIPHVDSITPTAVGQTGTATVTFTVSDTANYEVPVEGDKNSYTFKASTASPAFEWEKEWEVVPTVIPVKWTTGMITVDGKKVSVKSLGDEYAPYLKYVYYETDASGHVPEGATPLNEPEIEEGVAKHYVAEVTIKSNFDGNYVLQGNVTSARSPVFEAGKNITVVQLAAKKTSYPYNNQPVEFQYDITQGAITSSAFEIVYYKGLVKQANPPKDVGTYRAQIKLKSAYEEDYYIDGDSTFEFTIDKAVIKIDWDNGSLPPALKVKGDQALCITYEYTDSSGDTVGFSTLRTTPGTYSVRAVIKSASQKNYIFDNDNTETEWKTFELTQADIESGSVSDPNDPDGNKQYVEFKLASPSGTKGTAPQVTNKAGLAFGSDYTVQYFKDGEPASNFSASGTYQVKITLSAENANKYILIGDTLEYTIVEGDGTGFGTTTPNGQNGGGNGDNPSNWTVEDILPIILSGVSLVLIVVFAVMSLNSASAAKEAKAKTKKLATMTYSFAPASLLMLFGLSYTNWWIIAGVLMGVALIMAIVAFMLKGKKKKAFAALEEEQLRVADEKEYAKEEKAREDQIRRDNEMRMMFASMQQNYQQPQIDFNALQDSMQNMITSTVQALLPGLQQLQALPPASSDASVYVMPNPEADALRAQLAAQEERMAQQQDLLNQILENQQNYVMPLYEEEVQDDTSWLGNSEEVISLEESYGALSDGGKRAYYEIGSYIMNKPRTSQNDGRYAVLFKYRGRTIFKLAIKDDAPVLYYPAGGGRSEIRISDDSALSLAKSIIDRQTARIDSELN
ncbi:MAG: hypothetical protein K2L02_03315 [Clostridia bacterium]|nr:hypothetical protein [Clostridia bacterium]